MCIRDRHDIKATMPAPDFVGGGYILYNEKEIDNIYETGRGSVRVRAKYDYQRDGNMLEIRQIPPTTTVEAVMDKIAELVKAGRVKEISDMRDETEDVYKRQMYCSVCILHLFFCGAAAPGKPGRDAGRLFSASRGG